MGRPRRQSASGRLSRKSRPGPRQAAGRGGSGSISITSVSPVGNISGSSPTIGATVRHRQGTTLSKSDIHIVLDGQTVQNFQYRRMTGNLSFATGKLAPGSHTVRVEVAAGSGGNARKSWSFVVG